MAKTYTLTASRYGGTRGASLDPLITTYSGYTTSSNYTGYAGRAYDWQATSFIFNSSDLSALRAKTITKVQVVLTISSTWSRTFYLDDKANGSTTDWTIGSGESGFNAGTSTVTIDKGTSLPSYGYVVGPPAGNLNQWDYIIISNCQLVVTTNETDYSYALAFNSNGGTGSFTNLTGGNTRTSPSYTFTVPSNYTPTRTGHTFAGWGTSAGATTAAVSPGGTYTVSASGTTTLYAVWTRNSYTINIKCMDPESAVSDTAAYFDVWYSDAVTPQTNKTSLTVTKDYGTVVYINNLRPYYNYYEVSSTVDNMTSDGNGQYHYTIDENSANKNLVIHTTRAQYTIAYNANGGVDAPSSQTKYGGVELTLSNSIPSRDGYTFVKWNTASDGSGTDYNPSGSYTANSAATLYAIWVASSSTIILSNQSCEAGQSVDIHINKLTSTATHTLTYTCGNQNGTIVTKTSLSTVSWTVPTALVSQISEEGGPCYIYCTTYIDNVQTGVPQEAMLVVTVPSSYQPSVSLTVTKVNSNATVSGWGILLQGYSQVQLTATATMASGATLVSYNFTGPGVSYLGNNNQITSSVLDVYGKIPWSVTVTDSRGRTATATWEYDDFEIYQYSNPTIVNAITQRTDATGVSSSGTFFKTKVNISIASCNSNNSLTVKKVEYKTTSASTWTLGDDTITSNVWTSPYGSGTIDQTLAYNVRYTFTDALGNTATLSSTVSAVIGIGIGLKNDRLRLGGLPTKPGLQVDWDVEFNSTVDVTNRRCSATLSSAGWYRLMQTKDVSGTIIDFSIGRPYGANPAEAHKISFYIVGGGKSAFLDETSDTNTLCVDKIRATYGGGLMYFDVHYNASSANEVLVYFDVYGKGQANGTSIAMGLASVADAPAGETVLTTYTFRANYNPTMVDIWSAVTLNYSELRKDVRIQGGMVHILIETYFDSYQADHEYTLGSVSSPYRPLYPVFFTGHTVDANFNPKGLVTFIIYSDGTMTVRINNTNGDYLILNATYPIF